MTYEYVKPEPYEASQFLPHIVICDIDGTVARNNGHRGFFDYDKVADDTPIEPIIALLHRIVPDRTLVNSIHRPLVFVSGRQVTCRDQTEQWLWEKAGFWKPWVLMRKENDHRPDWIIKRELFDAHIRGHFYVDYVLDDRDQVVRLWRDLGLTCLQVADGNF